MRGRVPEYSHTHRECSHIIRRKVSPGTKGKTRMRPLEGKCWIKSITEHEIETIGTFEVTIRVEGRNLQLSVFVTKYPLNEKYSVLMGVDMLRKYRVIFNATKGSISYVDISREGSSESHPYPGEGRREPRDEHPWMGQESAGLSSAGWSAATVGRSEVDALTDSCLRNLHTQTRSTEDWVDGKMESSGRGNHASPAGWEPSITRGSYPS